MNKPHICFFGCGNIAQRHAKILKSLYKDIHLSFASRHIENAENYKTEFNGIHAFGSYEDALASKDYDIAFITTPHAYHEEIAVAAAKAKKDLIIEKPVTRNSKELKKIMLAVGKNGTRCTVAENYMFKPIVERIDNFITEGLIGDVLSFEVNKYNKDTIDGWRTDPELMGGGALLEGGVHWINFLVSIAGFKPVEVIAFQPDVNYERNAPFEDTITIQVKFENGAWGKLFHSWRIPNRFKGLALSKIYGTDGVITFESNGLFASAYGKKKKIAITKFSDFLGFKAMHKSFIEDWSAGRDWEPSMDRIAMELGVVEAAYKSIKTGKVEKV